jgi:predicted amidohydrolase YtcJ
MEEERAADLVLTGGKIATQNGKRSFASAVAIRGDRFVAVGSDSDALDYKGARTTVVDLGGRTAVPGLNDTHIHIVREGRQYNLETRWDGVRSLAEGLQRLQDQARRTPSGQWVRVVGSWSEFQFQERRVPTFEELNRLLPSTPAYVLHVYHDALLNRAALRALGITKDTPDPAQGEVQKDPEGNPTGFLIARPNPGILYSILDREPKLEHADQVNSTIQFLRELNRFGLTSSIDAGGGFQFYPQDYAVAHELAEENRLTVRIAYNLFTQRPKHELEDFDQWSKSLSLYQGSDFYRINGAGETLVYSAGDFECFMEPRPDLVPNMETELKAVAGLLARRRWPWRIHATYDESITRFLNVFEEVNDTSPIGDLRWFLDHAETISDKNLQRVKQLGGGIAVQDRMAFQGEHFVKRYGESAAERAPPIAKILEMGIPVSAGTDATRVASFNPWVSLYWLVTGKTVGGTSLRSSAQLLSRMDALRLYTVNGAWFSHEENKKGSIEPGKFADLAVLSADYFSIDVEAIKDIASVLTVVGGKPVYSAAEFAKLAPPAPPVTPAWSPVASYGGYATSKPPAEGRNADPGPGSGDASTGVRMRMSRLGPGIFGGAC